jgi:hypothetical protein
MTREIRKALLGTTVLLLAIPVFYFGVHGALAYIGPELYEGDRVEVRPCRQCRGAGTDLEIARQVPELGGRCPFCKGKGVVDVIVPGPNRPTRVWGVVVDLRLADGAPLRRRTVALIPGTAPPVPGGIPGAVLTFRSDGEPIEVEADSNGRFSRRFPPGTYQVRAFAPGFLSVEGEMEVPPLTEPIWLEKATLVDEPRSEADARSRFGISLAAGLALPGGDHGFIRTDAGRSAGE